MNERFVSCLESYFRAFVNELKITNKSVYTIASYNTTLTSFIEFAKQYEDELSFERFKRADLINFLEYKNEMLQKQSELKPSSKRLYITHLRTFFSFIQENMEIDINLNRIFKLDIRVAKRQPKGISDAHSKKLSDYIDSIPLDNFLNIRNSMVLKLLFYTGARRGELENITTKSFLPKGKIYVIQTIGKGNKERILYIRKDDIDEELEYYKSHNILHISVTSSGRIMTGSEIYNLVNNHYKRAGIDAKYSGAHILRHTFAKAKIAQKMNIVSLQKLLGHSNINTTMIYADPAQEEVERAFLESI